MHFGRTQGGEAQGAQAHPVYGADLPEAKILLSGRAAFSGVCPRLCRKILAGTPRESSRRSLIIRNNLWRSVSLFICFCARVAAISLFMRYGFVIDHNRCIGCHACTVACKEEHNVPLGVYRTWVKYIEKGEFPNARRHFGVLRCNHCDAAPCVEICPTSALFRRHDGIIDFDSERCIGCKSCMQACPYDALYIDPKSHTAAKCNFCAHRVEVGLEPACVIVCPEQAIIAGDLDDPASKVSRILATQQSSVRKPEKQTKPKV